jgi:two-component system, sensor histidine kinase
MLKPRLADTIFKKILIYLLVLISIYIGSRLSLLSKLDYSISDFYFPTAFSLVLIYWIGPKYVLPIAYLNSVITSHLWGNPIEEWQNWFLFAIPDLLFPLTSWLLFEVCFKGKYWLPDIRSLLLFLAFGVFVPAILESVLLQSIMLWNGNISSSELTTYIANNILGEFSSTFFVTLPVLYYVTPILINHRVIEEPRIRAPYIFKLKDTRLFELVLIFAILLAMVFYFEFTAYWYMFGFLSLYVALRFGFGPVVLVNFFILLITYVFQRYLSVIENSFMSTDVTSFFLAANFLFIFAAIAGRVISDLKQTRIELVNQNLELEQTNEELDHFVYRVSHDLSAPLKTIQGLVNLSRIIPEDQNRIDCINKIEQSVSKLEIFISQILDHLKNKRTASSHEALILQDLCNEVVEDLSREVDAQKISFEVNTERQKIYYDKGRLKMVLKNILSNAIKFQKQHGDDRRYIKIVSQWKARDLVVSIEDNGEGIKSEQLHQIFEMFYRGSVNSVGSGLGLYIAKETAKKIDMDIDVVSEYGKGSIFFLRLKNILSAQLAK